MDDASKRPKKDSGLPKRDLADQELIKQQRAEQTKQGDGKIKPMTPQERLPEPKR